MLRLFYRTDFIDVVFETDRTSIALACQKLGEFLEFKKHNYRERRLMADLVNRLTAQINAARAQGKSSLLEMLLANRKVTEKKLNSLSEEYACRHTALSAELKSAAYLIELTTKRAASKQQDAFGPRDIASLLEQIRTKVVISADNWPLFRPLVSLCDWATSVDQLALNYSVMPPELKGTILCLRFYGYGE